jgi:metal-responsive CopG/Arc/MetJ family transcriptional regulator
MRGTPSQAVTVSLPAAMLAEMDSVAVRLGATRSELFRAALRGYLRQLEKDEALLARTRAVPRGTNEEALAAQALSARRTRRSRVPT